jgi:hypothetical protein
MFDILSLSQLTRLRLSALRAYKPACTPAIEVRSSVAGLYHPDATVDQRATLAPGRYPRPNGGKIKYKRKGEEGRWKENREKIKRMNYLFFKIRIRNLY